MELEDGTIRCAGALEPCVYRPTQEPIELQEPPPPPLEPIAPVAPCSQKGRRVALAVVLFLSFLTVAYLAAPLWVGLMLGTVIAFTAQPLHRQLAKRLGKRRSLAAVLTTIIGGIVTAASATAAVYILTRELMLVIPLLQQRISSRTLAELLGERGARIVDSMGIERIALMDKIQAELARASSYVGQAAGVVAQTTIHTLLTLIIALWTMYYVLLEWARIATRLELLLPLDPLHTRALVREFRDVGRSAFIGTIATAAVQGLFAGVGFAIAGAPRPITLGILTALGSFIPVIGTGLIWVPIGFYFLLNGQPWWAVFTFLWGALVVMAVSDYIVRPRLAGPKGQGHPLLMLVSLLGGIEVLGLPGLIVGPILMSLFVAALRIYERQILGVARALTRRFGDQPPEDGGALNDYPETGASRATPTADDAELSPPPARRR